MDQEGWPAELRLLLGHDAGELLTAVAVAAGGSLDEWRPRQVKHRPQRSTVVQYRANMTWPGGGSTSEIFVAATGEGAPSRGAALFEDGDARVAVWRWPHDPLLPGLSDALDSGKVGSLLDELGIDGGSVQMRTRAYRPGQRAVVEVTGRRGRLFLKIVRPARAEMLHGLHRALSPHLPAPDSLGWTDDGVIVLAAKPGQTLRQALRSSSQPLPSPQAMIDLLDRLPADLAARTPNRDLLSSAEHHAEVIAAAVPTAAERARALVGALRSRPAPGPGEPAPVHGDLYEAQLLVHGGRITGLLDIDTVGAGLRVDDLANFCAHLSVLGLVSDRPKRIKRYGASLLARAEEDHHPGVMRPRIAAAVLGLATGPFRVLETRWAQSTMRRLELAEEWLGDTDIA
jgi:hypothetical protein